jgi:hypothetical protein
VHTSGNLFYLLSYLLFYRLHSTSQRPCGVTGAHRAAGPGAWRVIMDMRGAFLTATEVEEGAPVVFVAGLAADGGPADTQIWYMIQASRVLDDDIGDSPRYVCTGPRLLVSLLVQLLVEHHPLRSCK